MRADRLVAILLLLQSRGQVTAAEVAEELEVSERTARRDLEALGMAGIPIYSQQGRNGGWRLAGGGRTDLSCLTASEARALFLVAGPSSTATPQVKAALRKLVRALPEPLRSGAEAAATAVVVDPSGWDGVAHPRPTPPLLDAVQRAVVDGERVTLGYIARNQEQSTRVVHLMDSQTAEAFTFSTASFGGRDCVINLADQIKRMRGKHPNAVPLVELGAATLGAPDDDPAVALARVPEHHPRPAGDQRVG